MEVVGENRDSLEVSNIEITQENKDEQTEQQTEEQTQNEEVGKGEAIEEGSASQEVSVETVEDEHPFLQVEQSSDQNGEESELKTPVLNVSEEQGPQITVNVDATTESPQISNDGKDSSNLLGVGEVSATSKVKNREVRRASIRFSGEDVPNLSSIQEAIKGADQFSLDEVLNTIKGDKNPKLLQLDYKNLSNDDVKQICEVLRSNQSVVEVNLENNNFNDEATEYLSDLLLQNTTIQTLLLEGNFIKDEGVATLLDALRKNKTLTELTLSENFVPIDDLEELEEILDRNFDLLDEETKKKIVG